MKRRGRPRKQSDDDGGTRKLRKVNATTSSATTANTTKSGRRTAAPSDRAKRHQLRAQQRQHQLQQKQANATSTTVRKTTRKTTRNKKNTTKNTNGIQDQLPKNITNLQLPKKAALNETQLKQEVQKSIRSLENLSQLVQFSGELPHPLAFQVQSIRRVMIDKTYQSAMQGICKEDLPEVGYDLWLSDGKNLLPVVLHPSLHKLVTSGELALFSIIQVKSIRMWYDESKLRQNQVLVVTDTNVLGRIPKIVALNNARMEILFYNRPIEGVAFHSPLVGNRPFYSPLWDEDCFCHSNFEHQILAGDTDLISTWWELCSPASDCYFKEWNNEITALSPQQYSNLPFNGDDTIDSLIKQFVETGKKKVYVQDSSIVGRLTKKSKLRQFAKPDNQKYPYLFWIEISGYFNYC